MAEFIRDNNELVDATELSQQKLKAVNDETRVKIIQRLEESPSYPSEIAKEFDISKQKAYYHFQKLEDAKLIEEDHEEKLSGGVATFYRPKNTSLVLDLGGEGEKVFLPFRNEEVKDFLHPLVAEGELNGSIVVGSPDQHGPDQVRARDGHLAAELGIKLGNYAESFEEAVKLDTEVFRDESFDQNMLILGGVLTNTVAKKFNGAFPVNFEGETFPYREIKTPEETYSDSNIGIVAKADNPENESKAVFLVAGVRNEGTKAAVKAFKQIEDLVEDYRGGEYYLVVRALDMDGDGEIDDYELVEKK